MLEDFLTGLTGIENIFYPSYETRNIILAQGIDFRDSDIRHKLETNPPKPGKRRPEPLMDFLQRNFAGRIQIDGMVAEYVSHEQQVVYYLEIVHSRQKFKEALETEGIMVIYAGHSRYGRGTCFDPDAPSDDYKTGERWEQGTDLQNGIFRLGYTYVPVDISDISKHKYHFAPIPFEFGEPPVSERHKDYRGRGLSVLTMPEELREYVHLGFISPTNRYYGYSGGDDRLLLYAGWDFTRSFPYDLGATDLKCRAFCHFGCSSKQHFWSIIRESGYKNWKKDEPPTTNFAYFCDASSDDRSDAYFLYYLFSYNKPNSFQSWYNSLESAKSNANKRLISEGAKFKIY